MTRVIFAGPSLWDVPPDALAGLDRRPPAGCGDLLRAVRGGATAIGLVDGTFESGAAVWHKEILVALARGVPVLGAASMGALRAAECFRLGMIGIGAIFADYRDGRRVADADVAVLHGPVETGFRPLTVALVDAEATIEAMAAADALREGEAERLAAAATALHFKDRTWRQVTAMAGLDPDRVADIRRRAQDCGVSAKRDDALTLVRTLRGQAGKGRAGRSLLAEPLNRSLFLHELERRLDAEALSPSQAAE